MPGMTANAQAAAKLCCEVDVLDYTVGVAGIASGQPVQVAGLAGVALHPGIEGDVVGVDVSRAFTFPNPDLATVVGTKYAWSIAGGKIVAAGAGDFDLGTCVPTAKQPTGSLAGEGAVIALNL